MGVRRRGRFREGRGGKGPSPLRLVYVLRKLPTSEPALKLGAMTQTFPFAGILMTGCLLVGCRQNPPEAAAMNLPKPPITSTVSNSPTAKVARSEAEWRKLLTPEQFSVLRQAGTERPFGAAYEEFKEQGPGTYVCGGCGAELFSSAHKFDSHCGWPSFYDPANASNVVIREDHSLGMVRREVICARCDGHLGHVFHGEGFKTPTDARYCINGVSLKFIPAKAK